MDQAIPLFQLPDGSWITDCDLECYLRRVDAHKCKVLYIHSELNFGIPNPKLRPKQLLGVILQVIERLGVPTICMPTFTFSFCNGKDYNPEKSKSQMGALNEFFRKQPEVVRSMDPLMSVAVKGENLGLALNVSSHSISSGSTFDMIHHTEDVKFLLLGPRIGFCLTYMHYLEWLFSVDYRYIRSFRGKVIDGDKENIVEQDLFVRYKGVTANTKSYDYEEMMVDAGAAKRIEVGEGFISTVDEPIATHYYRKCLDIDPHFFVDVDNSIKDRTFLLEKEMVAL